MSVNINGQIWGEETGVGKLVMELQARVKELEAEQTQLLADSSEWHNNLIAERARVKELEDELDKMVTDDIVHRDIIRDMEARLKMREQPTDNDARKDG